MSPAARQAGPLDRRTAQPPRLHAKWARTTYRDHLQARSSPAGSASSRSANPSATITPPPIPPGPTRPCSESRPHTGEHRRHAL